eukprot:4991087-Pyramimonas_sp.AAC.1
MGAFVFVLVHSLGMLGCAPTFSWASPGRLVSPAAVAIACVAFGIGLIDAVDLALQEESALRLVLAVTPSHPHGPGVCSRLPIGTPAGETSTDISATPSALLPLVTRVAIYRKEGCDPEWGLSWSCRIHHVVQRAHRRFSRRWTRHLSHRGSFPQRLSRGAHSKFLLLVEMVPRRLSR